MQRLWPPLDPGIDRPIYYSGMAIAAIVIIVAAITGTTIVIAAAEKTTTPAAVLELSDRRGSIQYDIGTDWRMDSIGLLVCRGEDCRYLFLTLADGRYLEASGGSYSTVRFLIDAKSAAPLPWSEMLAADAADAAVVAGRMRAAAQDKTMATQCVRGATRQLKTMIGLRDGKATTYKEDAGWDDLGWRPRMEIITAAAAAWGCGS